MKRATKFDKKLHVSLKVTRYEPIRISSIIGRNVLMPDPRMSDAWNQTFEGKCKNIRFDESDNIIAEVVDQDGNGFEIDANRLTILDLF